MQTLIVYVGKTGSTEKCAKILAEKLTNVTLIDLTKEIIKPDQYDLIVVGSSIRMGMIHRQVRKFIKQNMTLLKSKQMAYYLCCGFTDNYQSYFTNNFSRELLNSAITYDTFGGAMDITQQKGFDKLVVKLVSKTKDGKKEVKILEENIDKFIKKLK